MALPREDSATRNPLLADWITIISVMDGTDLPELAKLKPLVEDEKASRVHGN